MSIEEKNLAHAHVKPAGELEELQDWWNKHGSRISSVLLIFLVGLLVYNLYQRQAQSKVLEASRALASAESAADMESVVANFKSSAMAPLALLRLGSEYYHQQQYDLAMGAYTSFLKDYPKHDLAPSAIVGIAHVAEAQGLNAEAEAKFRDFATSYPEHYLTPLAILGQARCLALQDHHDEARAILDRMMADRAGTRWSGMADELLAALPRLKTATPRPEYQDALDMLEQQTTPAAESASPETSSEATSETTSETSVESAPVAETAPVAVPGVTQP